MLQKQLNVGQLIGWSITIITIVIGAWISMRINVAKIETRLLEVEVKISKMEQVEQHVLSNLIEIKTNQQRLLEESRLTRDKFERYDSNIREFYRITPKH
ncbi:MAG: hypothetical protein OEW87_12025 [Flavobacteriaceae bacterium]|nr:hypothetical protein [Flavobacteriaceae bacterium]